MKIEEGWVVVKNHQKPVNVVYGYLALYVILCIDPNGKLAHFSKWYSGLVKNLERLQELQTWI